MRDSISTLIATAIVLLLVPACLAEGPRDSVLKIEVTKRYPDHYRPWSKRSPRESSGSGVMLSDGRILTNAHVVRYASQIEVQPFGSSDKYSARVLLVSQAIDLALLEFEDPESAPKLPGITINSGLPELQQAVTVLGYPMGGDELSVTEGVVSRLEFTSFYYDALGLRVQVDAALNPGNSGGPAISDGELIGLVFSTIREADNIGYLISSEEIEKFLADAEDGRYDGRATLRGDLIGVQRLENPALRKRLEIDRSVTGLYVREAEGVPEGSLLGGDVLTHIGEHPIDNQGFVRVNDSLRLSYAYFLDRLATESGVVPITVFRQGEPVELLAPIERGSRKLVVDLKDRYPEYFIWGPVVFGIVSDEMFDIENERLVRALSYSQSPVLERYNAIQSFEGEELVVITSRLFPHRMTRGYGNAALAVVETMNGTPVKNLAHLVELLRDCEDEYVEFDLGGTYETLVFDREAAEEATEEILTDEGIRRRGSKRLRKIWDDE